MILADLHVHTKYSLDSSISPKSLVDQVYAHPSIKVVAVTDHNTFEGYRKVRELASVYSDILVIPGIEIGTPLGDLIVLGLEELPSPPGNIENIINYAKKNDGTIIVPHPYRDYGMGSSTKHYAVDAIETLNGSAPPQINRLAEKLATEMGLPGVAGTDAHNAEELWTVWNEIQASMNVDDILEAVKKGLVKVSTARKSIHF